MQSSFPFDKLHQASTSSPAFDYDDRLDVELWQVVGRNWGIPVFVRHGTLRERRLVEVTPAVSLTQQQHTALDTKLNRTNRVSLGNGWAMPYGDLGQVARRATGITPSHYLKWNEVVGRMQEAPRPADDERDAFLEHLIQSCDDEDPARVTLIWVTLCNSISKWLLAGNVVRFGEFFDIRALPYRRNWLDILLGRVPTLRKVYLAGRATTLIRAFFASLGRWIRTPELMEARTVEGWATYHGWNLFVGQGRNWYNAVESAEVATYRALGPYRYMKRWAQIVTDREDEIHAFAAATVAQTALPGCRVAPPDRARSARLVSNPAVAVITSHVVSDGTDVVASLDDLPLEADALATMEQKAARLLGLSDAVEDVDVRNSERMAI